MKIKQAIAVSAVAAISAVGGATIANAQVVYTRFNDVPVNHPHATGIAIASDYGLVNGYSDGSFRPEQPVTRGQLATILARVIEPQEDSPLFECEHHGNKVCGPIAGHRHTGDGRIVPAHGE